VKVPPSLLGRVLDNEKIAHLHLGKGVPDRLSLIRPLPFHKPLLAPVRPPETLTLIKPKRHNPSNVMKNRKNFLYRAKKLLSWNS
jgi:hypothetical protein